MNNIESCSRRLHRRAPRRRRRRPARVHLSRAKPDERGSSPRSSTPTSSGRPGGVRRGGLPRLASDGHGRGARAIARRCLWIALALAASAAAGAGGLKRRELVERLAAALGQQGREEKVASYYHEMEQGLLPSEGVSDRVLEALAGADGFDARGAARGGERLAGGEGQRAAASAAFARAARVDALLAEPDAAPAKTVPAGSGTDGATGAGGAAEWDQVDELFRGRRA